MRETRQANEQPYSRRDDEVVNAARFGDPFAFATLFDLYHKHVLTVAFSILRTWEDAEDASQNVFLKVLLKLEDFQGKSSFGTWITRISVNESIRLLRKRRTVLVSLDEHFASEA